MSITAKWYPSAVQQMFLGAIQSTDTFKIALLGSGGSYNTAHTTFASDLQTFEIVGTNYVAGGNTTTITATSDANGSYFSTSQVTWEQLTATFSNAVVYDSGSGRLLLHLAFASTQNPNNQNYILKVPDPRNRATPV